MTDELVSDEFARPGALRRVWRRTSSFGYGLVAQGCSAATNLGLAVLAGHVLGPIGLGRIFVGFAAYLFLLGLQRGLVSEPLITSSAGRGPDERTASANAAITLSLVGALGAAAVLVAIGLVLPVGLGRGLVLFAPWLAPALVQDLGRSVRFRDRADRSAAASDATWLVAMAVTAPLAVILGGSWLVIACWGVGAIAGALVVLRQLRWSPVGPRDALAWWRRDASDFGRWLGIQGVLYNVTSYATVLALAAILGSGDYGGLRAVMSIFAPLTLLGPALALPGLPLVSRLLRESASRALLAATRLAGAITLVTVAYVVVLFVAASFAFPHALALLFGPKFVGYRSIIAPIGLAQVLFAPTFGLTLYLKARQQGRTLAWLGSLYALLYLGLAVGLGSAFGVHGAAWGGVAASALGTATLVAAVRPRSSRPAAPALERSPA